MEYTCEICSTTFERAPSRANRSTHHYCSIRCSCLSKRRGPIILTKSELIELYITQRLSKQEIATKIGGSQEIVNRWFRVHKIPVRGRVASGELSWEKSPPERRLVPQKSVKQAIAWGRNHPELLKAHALNAGIQSQVGKKFSDIERKMAQALNHADIPYVFQFVVGNKFACDFGIPEHMLIVECDGIYWHSSDASVKRDRSKDAYLRKCGYTVMRFTDDRIYKNLPGCIEEIRAHISKPR